LLKPTSQDTTVKEGGLGRWFTGQFMKLGQSQADGTHGDS